MVNSKWFLRFEWIWKALISTLQKEIEEHYSLIPRDQKFHHAVNAFPIGHATLHLSYIHCNNFTMWVWGKTYKCKKNSKLKRNRTPNIYKYILAMHERLWNNWTTFISQRKRANTYSNGEPLNKKVVVELEHLALNYGTTEPKN